MFSLILSYVIFQLGTFVGVSETKEYKTDILLNPCGYDGNFTNTTYRLHVPNGIMWVRLQEVHEREIFLIAMQLMALKRNHTDLVIMSSKLTRAVPVQIQQSFAPMEVISMTALANPPNTPQMFDQSQDGGQDCLRCTDNGSVHFEISSIFVKGEDLWSYQAMLFADAIFEHLKWSTVYVFYEEKMQHLVDVLLDHWSNSSVMFNTYAVDQMSEDDIVAVLESLNPEHNITKGMANFLVLCEEYFTLYILHVVSDYSQKHIRDSAIQHHTHWMLFLFSNDVIGERMLNNVSLDNLALIVLETEDHIEQKTCQSIENILLADECPKHGTLSGIESLKHTIGRIFHDNNNLCRTFPVQTLMWRDDGRELSRVGAIYVNGKLILHSKIFPNVEFGFNKRRFVVSTQPVYPFEFRTNNSFEGLCIDLLAQLAVELNFTFEVILPPDGDFGVMLDSGNWTGLIGQLQRQEVDLVAAPLSITIQREHVMDFIHPFFHDHSVVLIQKPDPQETKWRTLIDPYSDTVIISIGISLPLASLVLVVLENISPVYTREERELNDSDLNSFLGSFWYLFGALLTQGGKYTPHALSSRLFVGMWWLFCIISLATYSGNLIASLTVSKEKLPFTSLKEMVSQDNFKWGTYGGTVFVTMFKDSVIPDYKAIWRGMVRFNSTDPSVLNKNPDQHMQKVLGGHYAYIAAKTEVDTQMAKQCGLATIDEKFLHMQYAFGVPNNSPYTDIFSLKILKILECGLMNIWERKWWARQKLCYELTWDQRKVISLIDVQSAFYLIGIGIVVAVVVIGLEWFVYRIIRTRPTDSHTSGPSALPV